MPQFKLVAPFKPAGDQPQAIEKLSENIKSGIAHQTLLGVTGSGKTFTMANVIERVQKPTLVISHNKTLAAQLYQEFKEFFPENAVHFFVSYYDYYQPEAYIPQTDTYIDKDAKINDEIDRLRHAATQALHDAAGHQPAHARREAGQQQAGGEHREAGHGGAQRAMAVAGSAGQHHAQPEYSPMPEVSLVSRRAIILPVSL